LRISSRRMVVYALTISKKLVGIIKSFERCAVWAKNIKGVWEFHNGFSVVGKILGGSNYYIWRNLLSGFYKGMSIKEKYIDNETEILEISLASKPAYLCDSCSCHSRSVGGGE